MTSGERQNPLPELPLKGIPPALIFSYSSRQWRIKDVFFAALHVFSGRIFREKRKENKNL
jgi:hypothetical protein